MNYREAFMGLYFQPDAEEVAQFNPETSLFNLFTLYNEPSTKNRIETYAGLTYNEDIKWMMGSLIGGYIPCELEGMMNLKRQSWEMICDGTKQNRSIIFAGYSDKPLVQQKPIPSELHEANSIIYLDAITDYKGTVSYSNTGVFGIVENTAGYQHMLGLRYDAQTGDTTQICLSVHDYLSQIDPRFLTPTIKHGVRAQGGLFTQGMVDVVGHRHVLRFSGKGDDLAIEPTSGNSYTRKRYHILNTASYHTIMRGQSVTGLDDPHVRYHIQIPRGLDPMS